VTESGRVEARHTESERSAWDYTVGFFLRPQLLTHFEFEKLTHFLTHSGTTAPPDTPSCTHTRCRRAADRAANERTPCTPLRATHTNTRRFHFSELHPPLTGTGRTPHPHSHCRSLVRPLLALNAGHLPVPLTRAQAGTSLDGYPTPQH
jgi:hypothetical protein